MLFYNIKTIHHHHILGARNFGDKANATLWLTNQGWPVNLSHLVLSVQWMWTYTPPRKGEKNCSINVDNMRWHSTKSVALVTEYLGFLSLWFNWQTSVKLHLVNDSHVVTCGWSDVMQLTGALSQPLTSWRHPKQYPVKCMPPSQQ